MIKPKFTRNDVHKALQKKKEAVNHLLIRQLQVLGEKCVKEARSLNTYQDDTGNLRSSIGYAIYANKRSVHDNFESFSSGNGSGIEGTIQAKKLASKQAQMYHADMVVLIIVAGMNYAYSVETMGYDVLSSAQNLAEKEFPKLMNRLMDKIEKAGL